MKPKRCPNNVWIIYDENEKAPPTWYLECTLEEGHKEICRWNRRDLKEGLWVFGQAKLS